MLTKNCAAWLDRDINSITKKDAYALLDNLVKEGHGANASVTRAWIRKLWRWAAERDIVPAPIMDSIKIDYEREKRARVFTETDVKAIWTAADQLDPIEGGFVKLLVLLAPRKRELALMRQAHLDSIDAPTLWKTPFELTKARKTTKESKQRAYLTPLPALAQRILKPLLKGDSDSRVFPTLTIYTTAAGRQWFDGNRLIRRLVEHGAPEDFSFHAARHTIATWLHERGHSDWECGLVLNHASTGSVTGVHYLHSTALNLKRSLLEEWAEHVEGLAQPEGVSVLR